MIKKFWPSSGTESGRSSRRWRDGLTARRSPAVAKLMTDERSSWPPGGEDLQPEPPAARSGAKKGYFRLRAIQATGPDRRPEEVSSARSEAEHGCGPDVGVSAFQTRSNFGPGRNVKRLRRETLRERL